MSSTHDGFAARIKEYYKLWSAFDLDALKPLYEQDPNLVFYDVADSYVGWAAYQTGAAKAHEGVSKFKLTPKMRSLRVYARGDIVWTTVFWKLVMTKGEQAKTLKGRHTAIWQADLSMRVDERRWRIVHEHISHPVSPPPKADKAG